MHSNRSSRGIPVPSVWQLLVAAASICAGWLIWAEFCEWGKRSRGTEGVNEGTTEERLNTLRSVEALGKRGGEGISELVTSLSDPNPRVRRYALMVLRRLGPQAGVALDSVREMLSDEDVEVRAYAVDTYWNIRQDAIPVAQAVVARLGDQKERVRVAAMEVLERIGPPAIPLVLEQLRSENTTARVSALTTLRRIGWDRSQCDVDDAVRTLVNCSDPDVRAAALLTLVRWGQPLPGEIRELLSQPVTKYSGPIGPYIDSDPQSTALLAAIRMGPDAAETLPDILALFNEKSDRWYLQPRMVLEVLRNMKSAALAAAPRLFELFDESKGSYRSEIGWTLIEIGADRQELIGRLIPLLEDRDGDECRTAGWLLAYASPDEGRRQVSALILKISPDQVAQQPSALHAISGLVRVAQEAIPSLKVLLDQPLDDFSFLRLADTLGAIGPDAVSAVPALIGLLERDPATLKISHRLAIIRSLAGIGPAARPAVATLLSELKTIKTHHNSVPYDKREQTNSLPSVIRALALIGSTDAEVLAALRVQLTSDDDDASSAALDALLQLSPESPDLLAELLRRRPGSAYPGRELWTFAITRMTCDRREAVGPITGVLRNADPEARKLAAWALGAIGSEARDALPALHDALADWENSLYMARANMRRYVDNRLQDQINGSNRIRSSLFAAYYAKRIELQAPSVQDVVREAILRIDREADLQETIHH